MHTLTTKQPAFVHAGLLILHSFSAWVKLKVGSIAPSLMERISSPRNTSGSIPDLRCALPLAFLLLLPSVSLAQAAPAAKPNPRDARIAETTRYGGTDAHPLTFDYYKPFGSGLHPAVIVVHGGGFVSGNSRNGSEAYTADFLAPAGYAVFSINYRLAPGATFADMIADVQRSIRFVRHNASRYSVDPGRIALLGGSAGGYLSNMVGLMPPSAATGDAVDRESDTLAAVVTLYGPCCLNEVNPAEFNAATKVTTLDALLGTRATPEALLAGSPIAKVRSGAPPFLLIHGNRMNRCPISSPSSSSARSLRQASERS